MVFANRISRLVLPVFVLASATIATGCSERFLVGGAVGAAAAGGAYEYQNKKALNELERDLESGRISREEYRRRREEIDRRSLIY